MENEKKMASVESLRGGPAQIARDRQFTASGSSGYLCSLGQHPAAGSTGRYQQVRLADGRTACRGCAERYGVAFEVA